jgi:hypothetical protein
MAGEIKGYGGVSAMGEGHGHGLHELLRACESMGDQGNLAATRPEGAKNRGWNFAHADAVDRQILPRPKQSPATPNDNQERR